MNLQLLHNTIDRHQRRHAFSFLACLTQFTQDIGDIQGEWDASHHQYDQAKDRNFVREVKSMEPVVHEVLSVAERYRRLDHLKLKKVATTSINFRHSQTKGNYALAW